MPDFDPEDVNPEGRTPGDKLVLEQPDPLTILRQVISEALSPLAQKVERLGAALDKTTAELREEIQQVQAHSFADGVPASLRTDDPAIRGRMSAARSVTIPTRPVVENPQDYTNVASDNIVRNSRKHHVKDEE